MIEQIITFEAMEQAVSLFGSFDENIRMIEKEYNVSCALGQRITWSF